MKKKKSSVKPVDNPMRLATAVSERVEIENVRLHECSAKRGSIRADRTPSISAAIALQHKLDPNKPRLCILVEFEIKASYEHDPADSEEFTLVKAVFALNYRLSSTDGLSEKHYRAFAELNGVFNAWPYCREFVQSTTVRLGLPALILPSLKLSGSKVKSASEKQRPR